MVTDLLWVEEHLSTDLLWVEEQLSRTSDYRDFAALEQRQTKLKNQIKTLLHIQDNIAKSYNVPSDIYRQIFTDKYISKHK